MRSALRSSSCAKTVSSRNAFDVWPKSSLFFYLPGFVAGAFSMTSAQKALQSGVVIRADSRSVAKVFGQMPHRENSYRPLGQKKGNGLMAESGEACFLFKFSL